MIKPPYTKWINDIKTKLGFNRTMTASGVDVVDAVNKQAQQIGDVVLPTTAQTLTGAIKENSDEIAELETSKVPYFSQFSRLQTPIPNDGTVYEFTVPEDGYYAAIAVNSSVSGSCFAYFLSQPASGYISIGNAVAGTYIRASTAFLPLKQGAIIYVRCQCTSEAYLMKGIV